MKKLNFGHEARSKLGEGLNDLANAVKVTLGPRGRNVAIETGNRLPVITKDGVSVARSISFKDREKNMGAQIIKSVAQNANMISGDGTTTATVLAQELYNQGISKIGLGYNPVLIKRGLDRATQLVCDYLDEVSVKVEGEEEIVSVATISTNNDRELGELVAEVVSSVGEDGTITVVNGGGYQTKVSYSDGFIIDNGYFSPNFVNNLEKLRCEFEDPFILVFDGTLSLSKEVVPVMTKVSETGKPLVVIAKTFEGEAFQTFVLNHSRGALKSCLVKAPGFGNVRREMLDDIALYTGAKLFTSDSISELDSIELEDLGRAERIEIGQNKTTIIGALGDADKIIERVDQIKYMLHNPSEFDFYDHQISSMVERLTKLSGTVATIKIGGLTESEQKERKDRVEDCINAVRAAIQEGIVSGGGSALLHSLRHLKSEKESLSLLDEEKIGFEIMEEVLKAPFIQIMNNSGIDYYPVMFKIINSEDIRSGYDAFELNFEDDLISKGVIDPVKVVKSSLSYAVSAVGTLLTTEAIITEDESDE
jgi:chaperonin GroEL